MIWHGNPPPTSATGSSDILPGVPPKFADSRQSHFGVIKLINTVFYGFENPKIMEFGDFGL